MWLVDLNYIFECDWLIELSDNKLSNNKLSNNKLSNNKLSDNNLASELVENKTFLSQSQERKRNKTAVNFKKGKYICPNILYLVNVYIAYWTVR